MKIIGWISPEGELANTPLLGMPSGAYVARAMTECGVSFITQCGMSQKADVALVVRQDAPGLGAETLKGLASVVAGVCSRPSVLMAQDLQTPLAVAMDMPTLRTATEGETGLPRVERLVENLNERGIALRVWHDSYSDTYFAVRDAQSFADAYRVLNAANVARHMQNGVIVLEPERTVIEDGVQIGVGAMIYPNNTLGAGTVIGQRCTLYPGNRLQNARLGDEVTAESSVLCDCVVGDSTVIGPYACMRDKASVGARCVVGAFTELTSCAVGDSARLSGLTRLNDADIGKAVQVGCGVAFVADASQARCRVDDEAVIGSNCSLIAPVSVGRRAYLASGGTVVEDVPAGALYVARSRGVTKHNWRDGAEAE